MNVQIFGTKKCNDTKKAERFFKERGIKFQFIDMKEKGMSKGEFRSDALMCVAAPKAFCVLREHSQPRPKSGKVCRFKPRPRRVSEPRKTI